MVALKPEFGIPWTILDLNPLNVQRNTFAI